MKVSLKDDSLADGTELHVVGLGTLVNGSSVEFDDEQVALFEQERGLSVEEAFASDDRVKVGKASNLPAAKEDPNAVAEEEVEGGDS